MTRDEAIKILKGIREEAGAYEEAVCYVGSDEDIEAIDMAIEALSAEAKTKCIAQIKVDTEEIVRRIKEEYDITDGWIPCGERLPSERQDVYVTVLWDDYGDYITAYGMRTQFGWNLYSNAEGELIKGYTVVAWMPLPKPYKGGDAE